MKKTRSILIISLLIALTLCACLVACNDKEDAEKKERAAQSDRIEQIFLGSLNEAWGVNLSNDDVAKISNAGDYVVTQGWTRFVCDVIRDSSMQTAKIRSLADTLQSDDGKKLLKEFSDNAELLVPMLKQIGLTSNDVSSLAYDLIAKLINDGRSTISNIVNRLDNVKDIMVVNGGSAAAIENVAQNRAVLNLAQQSLNATSEEKAQMQTALANAKNAMSELVSFAYDTSVNTLTDELYSKLFEQDGALSNVSESELSTLVGALLGNVKRLKNALTESEIERLNTALNLFITEFDDKKISSQVYSQILIYAKYAYMAVDVIPSLCEIAEASENVLSQKEFISDFLLTAKFDNDKTLDKDTNAINKMILAARVIDGVMESGRFNAQNINSLIERICKQGSEGYQKAMPVIVLDLLLNVSDIMGNAQDGALTPSHPDIIDNDTFTVMVGALLFSARVEKMKQAYYDFELNSTKANLTKLYNEASLCGFEGILGESNPNVKPQNPDEETVPYIKAWYNWYIGKIEAVSAKIASCIDPVEKDLKAFVADYYADGSKSKDALKQIAGWNILSENIESGEMESKYFPVLLQSRILGASVLFVL